MASFPLWPRGSRAAAALLGLGLGWGLLAPRLAAAQPRDAAASEALFQEGRRLMKSRDFAAACPKLEESLRLDPALGTLVNLAACEEELGHTATAWQHWRAAADQLPPTDKRRATAVERAGALEKLLARLAVALAPGVPAGAEVARDGVHLGEASLGLPLPVDPGKHTVVVTAPGREPRSYEIDVPAKGKRSLTVEAGAERPVPAAPPPRVLSEGEVQAALHARRPEDHPPPAPPQARSSATVGLGLLAGGAVLLGGGAWAGLQALSARKDAEKDCASNGANICWASAKDALDRDKRYSLLADAGVGTGVVLVGLGAYFLLRPAREAPATHALVTPLPGGAALQMGGRF